KWRGATSLVAFVPMRLELSPKPLLVLDPRGTRGGEGRRAMSMEIYRSLLKGLGATIGLPDLAPDDEGFCAMQFGDRIVVNLQYEAEREDLALFARLGDVEPDLREAAYEMLLAGNLFWKETAGATLSVEPTAGTVYLAAKQAIQSLDQPRFEAMLNEFV